MANTTGKKFGGRTKGTPNKTSKKINDICDASGKLKPAEYLLETMHDEATTEATRLDCAKALLPYTDRKMPTEIEQTNKTELEGATEEELIKRLSEIEIEGMIKPKEENADK